MKYYVVSSHQLVDLLESGRIPPDVRFCSEYGDEAECPNCIEEAEEVAKRYGFEEVDK